MATSNGSLVAVTGVVLQLLFLFTFSRGQGPGTVDPVQLQVRENVAIGSTVGDIPTLPNFTYVLSENPGNLFSLNPNTGILKTASNIDRENLPTENPVKIVVLSSSPIYFIDVFVEVLDENDNSPVFPQQSIAIEYSEAAASGTQAVLRTATDPDLGLNSVTSQYTIVSGNEDNKFRLVVFSEASQPFLYVENLVTLDREEKDFYQLNISAQDGGSPPRSGFLLVNITITDINDTPPVFDQSDYAARVNESAPAGTTVIQVRATDRDMGSNGDITYSVVDDTVQFAIDPKTGVLTTLQKLQCTARCATCNNSCIVTVEARDNGQPQALQGRAYVTVSLIDENDHDPVISFKYIPQTAKMASVSESVPKDSIVAFVSVSDKDQGVNQNTYVRIIHGNELNHFYMVSPIPGLHLVRVNGSLDRERIKVYNLTILAQDGGSPPRSSTAHLIIHVSDENDHPPVFEKTNYVVNLSELAPVGSFVAGLTATDNDTDINAHITYTIVSGNQQQWFQLDRNSGLVTTRRPLDHETVSQVTMNISAQDGGSQPYISFASLKVYIQDENDEVPQFEEQIIHASLVEGTVSASLVTVLTATDRDSGSNGSVQYVFAPSVNSQYPQTFSLSPTTGRLETTKVLDRETVPFYTLHVIARDGGTPPLSATATVYLNVTDINDNSPEFYPKRYYTAVQEGMPPPVQVQQVTATDLDEGTNALVRYAIENGNADGKFTIDAVSGVISTTQELRQSQGTRYNLTVSTYEVANPSVKHFATVLVSVTIPGSSGPQFSTSSYSFTIMEDTGNQFVPRNVGQVRVTGSVTGVTFEIADGDPKGVFSIGQSTGNIITAKILDREMQPFYTLKVIASDGTLFSESTVHVTVTDANDNAPQFPANRVEVSMPEKLQVGHKVYRAEAVDVDYGSNSELSYILTSDANGTFSIGQSTGVIELEKPVSWTRGGVNSFTVHVTVRDKGLPQRSSSMEVTINVIDVNDHTPSFQQSRYEIAVSEALPVNYRFFQVTATDADGGQNGEVVYNITRGGTAFFKIFPDGVLYIAQELDREAQEIYHLTIKAEDRGTPSRSSFVNVTIHVRDDNDNPPQFTNSSYVMQVYENSEAGTYIGSVSATDRDTDRNAELFYFISSDQTDFTINPTTGAISTLRSFDREEIRRQFLQDYVMFEVTVMDNGLHRLRDTATVEVRIIDRNDNAPVFTHILYEATVFESAPVTTLVQKVTANDQDQGVNGQVSYSIESGNEDGVFSLDPGTGDIKVAGQLDRETNSTYTLIVNAEDSADSPSFTATATVRITVLDANDNSPQFIHTTLRADISETATPGEFITQFSATDADILNNAAIQFSIASGNTDNTFNLDAKSGKLYLQKKLDYEQTPQYLLEIMASDRGSPRQDTTVIFVVSVQDSNDNSPQFSTQPAVFHVAENNNPNIPVAVLTATDLDSGTNGEIRYSILHQDPVGDYFDINPTSGQIIAKKRIDRELIGRFNLTVKGTDQATPVNTRRSSLKTVTILVDDVNDNAPVFTSLTAAAVSVLGQAGSQVMNVRAEDPDAGPNGVVTYTLSGGDTNLFTLQSNTGVLLLKSSIPSSRLKYSVSVTATDSGTPRLSSTSTIDIIIKATTENGPTFTGNTPYSGSVYENQTPGTSVSVQVQASSPGAQVEYYITGITSSGQQMPRYFAIDRQTGVVTTAVSLDYDLGQHSFSVDVYAIDVSGSTSKTRKTQVSITLLDQNDTPPSFGSSLYEVNVPEDVQPGYVVASLVAQDVDSEGTVTYRISSGDLSVFQVNGNT
ncbi:LOW QUALITY PROTEIN: cadherin-related tumor suppressor-like, partial [Lingula anatina]|uniref:LOW QUALITY PROTEIN: cadherin-related tumor suppressor-like n=1 Tax=Lingula anatina TaxID=7574 RepID=A0A1S3K010_LINAN